MSGPERIGLRLGRCRTCHARFVPVAGPCPRCASTETDTWVASGLGKVLAATELEVPPPGWDRPHPLALVEIEDGVRLLVIPDRPLPAPGALVEVREDGPCYRAGAPGRARDERGEGDAPGVGTVRPPFEPPR